MNNIWSIIDQTGPTALRRAPTKTIALTGAAGLGAVGDVTVWTITGRVIVCWLTAFCTEDLASAGGGTISLGTASRVTKFLASITATTLDINEWWVDGSPLSEALNIINQTTNGSDPSQMNVVLSSDVIIDVLTADVTDGTIVFDCWYLPITSNGSLA